MKAYMVRHGETYWNVEKRSQGWSNNPLNENGMEQIMLTAKKLKSYKIEHFYSSDLMRTKQSSEIINKELGMEIHFDWRLRERCSGDLQGQLRTELPKETLEEYEKNPKKFNAETFEDMFIRAKSFIDELKSKNLNNVLMVTHGGIMCALRYCAHETEWDENKISNYLMHTNNGEIVEIDF